MKDLKEIIKYDLKIPLDKDLDVFIEFYANTGRKTNTVSLK
jgi:hypothetical protein